MRTHIDARYSSTYVDSVLCLCMTEGIWCVNRTHFSPHPIYHHHHHRHHHHLSYNSHNAAKMHGIWKIILIYYAFFSPICSVNLGDGIRHYHIAIIFDTFKRSFGVPGPCIKRTRTQQTRSLFAHTRQWTRDEREQSKICGTGRRRMRMKMEWNEWWAFTQDTCSRE